MSVPRRGFLKVAGLSAIGAALLESGVGNEADAAGRSTTNYRKEQKAGIKLGVASYSLRNFARDKAIEMTRSLGVRYINFKSMHLPYDASPAEIADADALDRERVAFWFDRHGWARLRELIDRLNGHEPHTY